MRERFNTVAVGLPAQQFHIRCHVTLERQVPVRGSLPSVSCMSPGGSKWMPSGRTSV